MKIHSFTWSLLCRIPLKRANKIWNLWWCFYEINILAASRQRTYTNTVFLHFSLSRQSLAKSRDFTKTPKRCPQLLVGKLDYCHLWTLRLFAPFISAFLSTQSSLDRLISFLFLLVRPFTVKEPEELDVWVLFFVQQLSFPVISPNFYLCLRFPGLFLQTDWNSCHFFWVFNLSILCYPCPLHSFTLLSSSLNLQHFFGVVFWVLFWGFRKISRTLDWSLDCSLFLFACVPASLLVTFFDCRLSL